MINGVKNIDKEFYLVEQDHKMFIVMITDEYIESREIDNKIVDDKFEWNNWEFIKCRYQVKDNQ